MAHILSKLFYLSISTLDICRAMTVEADTGRASRKKRRAPASTKGSQKRKARSDSRASGAKRKAPALLAIPPLDQFQKLNSWFEIALNNMARGLSMFDSNQRLVVCNNLYREIFDLPEELTRPGTPFSDIIHYHVWKETGESTEEQRRHQLHWIENHVAAMVRGRSFSETKNLKNGRVILVTNQPLPEGGWVDLQEDITEKYRAENKIAWLARHDTLTELSNRFHFREELQKVFDTGNRFAVLWIDLDRFKDVNDTHGHPVGDGLLKSVAERLRKAVRKSDIVARLGGDEFALIRSGSVSEEQLESLAQRLIRAIEGPHQVLGTRVNVSASIGIAFAPEHGADADEILRNADLALYSAKTNGRGIHAFYRPGEDYGYRQGERLENDLRFAIKRNQLQLYYQPIVNLATEQVASFEALMRWWHPDRGMVSPAEFIPIAEESGLIVEIGRWAMLQACKDAVRFPKHVKVTVNLSSVQFEKGDLYKVVVDALRESRLSPERLELEITETVLLRDRPMTHDTLHRIRKLGVKIALDDFGTAYASLSYLRSFPFDKIKIDRSFVREVDTPKGNDCIAIVESVAGLAKRLQMRTVAEGVETPDQFNMVSGAGCDEVQGFYFSKPVPVGEIGNVVTRCQDLFRQQAAKRA
jgi:diguanylate cyclase (GGDEF)-like protein